MEQEGVWQCIFEEFRDFRGKKDLDKLEVEGKIFEH